MATSGQGLPPLATPPVRGDHLPAAREGACNGVIEAKKGGRRFTKN
jgi:hypothetical protein